MSTICVAITWTGHVAIQISKLEYVYQNPVISNYAQTWNNDIPWPVLILDQIHRCLVFFSAVAGGYRQTNEDV